METKSWMFWNRKADLPADEFVRLQGDHASLNPTPFEFQEVLSTELNEVRKRRKQHIDNRRDRAASDESEPEEKPLGPIDSNRRRLLPFTPHDQLADGFQDVIKVLERESKAWDVLTWKAERAVIRWLEPSENPAAPDGALESIRVGRAALAEQGFQAKILPGGLMELSAQEADPNDQSQETSPKTVDQFVEIISLVTYQNRNPNPNKSPRRFLIAIGRTGGTEIKVPVRSEHDQEPAAGDGILRPLIEADKLRARLARRENLTGLALSGGGVRSATFNLGIIQGLRRLRVFDSIDYMSTVSGGGYIGASISALYTSQHKFPYEHIQGEPEPLPFRHLRNFANYLSPAGIQDLFRVPALFLRGILINAAIVLPWLLIAAIVTGLIWPEASTLEQPAWILGLLDEAINAVRQIVAGGSDNDGIVPTNSEDLLGRHFVWTKLLFSMVLIILFLFPLARRLIVTFSREKRTKWAMRDRWGQFLGFSAVAIAVIAFVEAQPLAVAKFGNALAAYKEKFELSPDLIPSAAALISFLMSFVSVKLAKSVSSLMGKTGLFLVGALGFFAFWLIYLDFCRWIIFDSPPDWVVAVSVSWFNDILASLAPTAVAAEELDLLSTYAVIALALIVYGFCFVDVNETTLHAYYRDRLSKAFLIRYDETQCKLEHCDALRLSNLGKGEAPYHLINAALNVRHQEEIYRKGRHADFFFFAKRFVGGEMTGYCPSKMIEEVDPHLNLGTAMAISGAAASPNMGKITIKPLVFIMAMLNVRLNYWLPNPRPARSAARYPNRKRAGDSQSGRPGAKLTKNWTIFVFIMTTFESRVNERKGNERKRGCRVRVP